MNDEEPAVAEDIPNPERRCSWDVQEKASQAAERGKLSREAGSAGSDLQSGLTTEASRDDGRWMEVGRGERGVGEGNLGHTALILSSKRKIRVHLYDSPSLAPTLDKCHWRATEASAGPSAADWPIHIVFLEISSGDGKPGLATSHWRPHFNFLY